MTIPRHAEPPIHSVSELTGRLRGLVQEAFTGVWVAGEISDLSRPQSGHIYLTLKDDEAQMRAVIWRSTAQRLRFDLADGLEILACGDIDVYPPRGSYQLMIRQLEPRGIGALQLAWRQLHARLAAEGLFDPARKRPLPKFPQAIALVTSPTGAAARDFLQVVSRRWPQIRLTIVPVQVQGSRAAREVAAAIDLVNRLAYPPDVIVVARGGGSLEDLWSFNEEIVVRAVSRSHICVVSAIGHEVDVTLCDLAADVRALTPSEAAERVVPLRSDIDAMLIQAARRLATLTQNCIDDARRRLDGLSARTVLRRPQDWLHDLATRLDERAAWLDRLVGRHAEAERSRLDMAAARLAAVNPLAVLARGYTVTTTAAGDPIGSVADVAVGDRIQTLLASGRLESRVESIERSADPALRPSHNGQETNNTD